MYSQVPHANLILPCLSENTTVECHPFDGLDSVSHQENVRQTLDLECTRRYKLAAMELTKDELSIQEAAEATGLSTHTLRYYERVGLIHPIARQENTRRSYSAEDIGWIDFLTRLRATGMSIREMQKYAELQRQGEETLPERVELLKRLRDQVESRIRGLQENLKLIHYKIEIYGQMIEERELEKS
jgi:DNA-binding transcriptional MerR regulator